MHEMIQSQSRRLTNQRHRTPKSLAEPDSHHTVGALYTIAHQRVSTSQISTVYRTLRWFDQQSLVSSWYFKGRNLQVCLHSSRHSEHHHIACSVCQQFIEFHSPLIEDALGCLEQLPISIPSRCQ